MVGYDPGKRRELSPFQYATAAAASGMFSRLFTQPLDVVKIRLQLQVEPTASQVASHKYSSVIQTFKLVVREEGMGALWKGHVPAQWYSIVYGIAQFTSFEALTKLTWSSESLRPASHFACGALAGCFANTASMPFDVLRTRLAAQGNVQVYHGLVHAGIHVYRTEGAGAFFRGLLPTLMQIAPFAGIQFSAYTTLTEMLSPWLQKGGAQVAGQDDMPEHQGGEVSMTSMLVCGALAGMIAKVGVYPLEVVKRRLQVQGFEEARKSFGQLAKYNGMADCFHTMAREEGLRAFFKGLSPALVKAALATALQFSVYEQLCTHMRKENRKRMDCGKMKKSIGRDGD